MNECLNCKKEYPGKRPHSKFCSVKCRVMYNRKNPKQSVTPVQMQVLYNEILELAAKIKDDAVQIRHVNPLPTEIAVALHNAENKDQLTTVVNYDYNGLKQLITSSTSSYDIERAWRIVKAATWLAGWQLKELTRLKDLQQTKIDF